MKTTNKISAPESAETKPQMFQEDSGFTLEAVPKTSASFEPSPSGKGPILVSVAALAEQYGIRKQVIYEWIKVEPEFPFRNAGAKKKYMIDPVKFDMWLAARTEKEKLTRPEVVNAEVMAALDKK